MKKYLVLLLAGLLSACGGGGGGGGNTSTTPTASTAEFELEFRSDMKLNNTQIESLKDVAYTAQNVKGFQSPDIYK